MARLVAYYRVSTQRQGRSGLGLAAQRQAVAAYARQIKAKVVAEYREVETGKGRTPKRPQLTAAIAQAKGDGATLVIARLDRLARNVAFTSALMESKVPFVACDNPHATKLTIHILAAVAEHESDCISERTRAALAEAKLRGTKLGRPAHKGFVRKPKPHRRGKGLRRRNKQAAKANQKAAAAFVERIRPIIAKLRKKGWSMGQVAAELNRLGHRTRTKGRMWTLANVSRIVNQ